MGVMAGLGDVGAIVHSTDACRNCGLSGDFPAGPDGRADLSFLFHDGLRRSLDNQIHVSREGLFFPLVLLPKVGFTKYLPWDRVVAADLVECDQRKKMRLVLKGFGAVDVPFADIGQEQVEQLLLAVEVWADKCERTPHLIAYQHEVQNATKGIEGVSYTQMWEEELSRKFTTTAFIPLEPGAVLKQSLKVVRQLSFGGFSAIYLVQDELGAFMVAKEAVIPASVGDKQRAKAQEHFVREAALLTKIDHPGIARVFDHFSEGARNYILLEYIEGQNLRQHVNQRGAVDNRTASKWASELAQILDFLHLQAPPIVHRDFSPDNVMLMPDGKLVLIDFGAANHFVTEATGTMVGKQAYMPAEQLRGKAVILSDYYSFGGTLHFLLTGHDPVPLATSNPRLLNNQTSPELDRLVAQLTSFEAVERTEVGKNLQALVRERLGVAGATV